MTAMRHILPVEGDPNDIHIARHALETT